MQRALDWSTDVNVALVIAPSRFSAARETSALAGAAAQPTRGDRNAQLLALITAAGEDGMSDPEIERATGWSRQSICIRRFDLRGFLVPSTRRAKSPSGRVCICWRRATTEEMATLAEAAR
jgi:hypothetical protein